MLKDNKCIEWVGVRWVAMIVLLLMAIPSFAQLPTGTILGVVKDSSGAVVPGVSLTITNTDTSLTRTGTTTEDGSYRFPALPVGRYRLEVTEAGFSALTRTGITLAWPQEAAIDVTLEVGAAAQTVTVAEEVPLVQTTSSTMGGLVNEEQVANLPLNGRNLVALTLMQAGVIQTTVIPATTIGSALSTGVTISHNGMPIHANSYMLDGANMIGVFTFNNSSIIGTTAGVDGVKEYKVVTNTPSAEYGLSMGSQTTIVSKGGANQFHGDVFDYLRNDVLDARNYFDALDKLNFNGFGPDKSLNYPGKRLPPFHRNNFGASLGGPIKKDKTFLYAVYEGLRQTWGQTVATNTLPGNCFDSVSHVVTAMSLSACSGVPTGNMNLSVLHVLSAPIIQPGQDMGGFTPASTVTGLGFIAADGQYVNNIYTYSDDIFWTKGKHAFKFGTLINKYRIPEDGHFNNRGTVAFTNLSNLAQGIYSNMTALGGTLSPSQARLWGQRTFGFYVQDDYRVMPRLTLNLGFRYEFGTIPTELRGRNWQI